jgi:putative ABC transport system permease protein
MIDDLKFAWRSLRNAPGFTLVAVTTLALAIGANAAIFSIADAVLFRKLPYTDPESVYVLHMLNRENGRRFGLLPYQYLQVIDAGHAGLTTVGMLENLASAVAEGESGAEFVPMVAVTANYFQLLGVTTARGRVFDARDESAEGRPAMLTYSSWQSRFGGDPTVTGRAVRVGSTTFDVVGVLPKSFVFPSVFAGKPELIVVMPPVRPGTAGGAVNPIVRLEPGVTREQAQSELDALLAPVAAAQPKPTASLPVLDDVRSVLYPVGQPVMRFLLAAAGCVLLIACINLANMLMARGERGRRETGVRAALGANRRRLIMPLVFESLLIGVAAAALAVLTTSATFEALLRHVPPLAYRNAPVGVDLRVTSFAMILGLLASFSFAVIPAWRSARVDVRALIDKSRITARGAWKILDRPLVAMQVALAVVLVFSAAMVGRACCACRSAFRPTT